MDAVAVRTLVVWCPDWPVVATGRVGVPVAVMRANWVVACSAAARAEGVRRGLRRREAQGRCPELVVTEPDPAAEARAFEAVVGAVERFCPRVEIVRPGLCAFATRGPSRYFGGDEALGSQVAAGVAEVSGSECQVGIADGPFAATLAARRGGGTIVPPGQSEQFLAPLPVSALERPELTDLLVRLGLRTLGQFAALPATHVLGRFGPDGALAHRLARGLDERPLLARIPPPDLVASVELDPPAQRVDTAAFAAKALADQLHARLADLGLACTRVAIEAETEHGERLVRLWRHDGALTAGAMAERVRWQLDGWLSLSLSASGGGPTGGLVLLRLVPDEVKPDSGRQLGFWGSEAAADERVGRVLARLQGMLGPEAVVTGVLGGGRSPVEQVRLVPWGDAREPDACPRPRPRRRGAVAEVPPWPGRVPAPSPAVVHVEPRPAEVIDQAGKEVVVTGRGSVSADPSRLSIAGGRWTTVAAWAGPWPVDERWWDPSAHRRRARFQVLTVDGTAHLLVREGGSWWVEATYD